MPGIRKGKDIQVGWKELVSPILTKPPEGYSTIPEIAKNIGRAQRHTREMLRRLRVDNKIRAEWVLLEGHWQWCYKD